MSDFRSCGDMLVKMTANDDLELLSRFAREKSQDAFTELVRRHVDLIYSAALRQVNSPDLAREVAQSVFLDLARDAGKLKPDTILTAWLYRVTRRTAVDVIRRESRRAARERLAAEMALMNATAADGDWTHIEPLLDDAMEVLEENDCTAVLLRFFANKSLREVGAALGISDDAAQKRVSRALERLREFFARRGVAVGAGGFAAVVTANAVQAAPAGLAVAISTTVVTSSGLTAATATKATAMTAFQRFAVTAALTAAAGAGIYEVKQAADARAEVRALQQQQSPLVQQIQQLQREQADAANALRSANDNVLKAKANQAELLELRGEVGLLRRQKADYEKLLGTADSRLPKPVVAPAPTAPAERIFANNYVVTDNPSDEYARTLSDLARETNSFAGDARNLQYALVGYAKDHGGQWPQQLSELEPYKWTDELPLAGSFKGPDTLAGTNYFDIAYHGSLDSLSGDLGNEIAILRQHDAWPTPDGKQARVYVTYLRRVFVVESSDNFVSWEAEHLRP